MTVALSVLQVQLITHRLPCSENQHCSFGIQGSVSSDPRLSPALLWPSVTSFSRWSEILREGTCWHEFPDTVERTSAWESRKASMHSLALPAIPCEEGTSLPGVPVALPIGKSPVPLLAALRDWYHGMLRLLGHRGCPCRVFVSSFQQMVSSFHVIHTKGLYEKPRIKGPSSVTYIITLHLALPPRMGIVPLIGWPGFPTSVGFIPAPRPDK